MEAKGDSRFTQTDIQDGELGCREREVVDPGGMGAMRHIGLGIRMEWMLWLGWDAVMIG